MHVSLLRTVISACVVYMCIHNIIISVYYYKSCPFLTSLAGVLNLMHSPVLLPSYGGHSIRDYRKGNADTVVEYSHAVIEYRCWSEEK